MRSLSLALAGLLPIFTACGGDEATVDPGSSGETPSTSSERTTKSGEPPPSSSPAPSPSSSPAPTVDPPTSARSLHDNRDRLIDTLAAQKQSTRCPLWTGLTPTQKGVFLTITDLLGKRSYLTNDAAAGGGARKGEDLVMALDHVTKVYEVRDSYGSNGGAGNRIWLQVDATLIATLRKVDTGLPAWSASTDFAGPHSPFDADSETVDGQPRGQAHFWSDDAKAKALGRPGVEEINDPHVVEIDIDYDLFHNSNPEGSYFPNGKGSEYYAKVWTSKGAGGAPELDYVPSTCPK